MRLYHFLESTYALKDIRERRLKVSQVDKLNDPFELMAVVLSDKTLRRVMRAVLEAMVDKQGIICFCDNWRNPVMWAHYGDRHRGICLGFDVHAPNDALVKMNYVPRRLKAPDFLTTSKEELHAFFKEFTSIKYKHWEYEGEHRLHIGLNDPPIDGLHYFDFGKELVLREVIVGADCPTTRNQVRDVLGDLSSSVEAFKARPGFQNFEMVRNRDKAAWK